MSSIVLLFVIHSWDKSAIVKILAKRWSTSKKSLEISPDERTVGRLIARNSVKVQERSGLIFASNFLSWHWTELTVMSSPGARKAEVAGQRSYVLTIVDNHYIMVAQ